MCTPAEGRAPLPGALWAGDNGCFGKGYPGGHAWFSWLRSLAPYRSQCLFVAAPDVIGDAGATLARAHAWLPLIRREGYPAALVAQDGLEALDIPWDDFDALFIGGTTEWKLGRHAADVARDAVQRGKWVHMGRVNSGKRWKYAQSIGCESVDGTFLTFGPTTNLARLRKWIQGVPD